jgi:hypothetical protein
LPHKIPSSLTENDHRLLVASLRRNRRHRDVDCKTD